MNEHMSTKEAASRLGLTRPKLFALLKEQGLLFNNNLPTMFAQSNGLLRTEIRSTTPPNGIERQYTALLVTAKGLSYIQELIENGKTPTRVRGAHYRPANPSRAPRCPAASARASA